jgi:perosamine synthetase
MFKIKLFKKIFANIILVIKKTKFLHEPYFISNEKKYLLYCIKKNHVSSVGSFLRKFEEKIKKYTRSKHVILTNSGTSAIHLALLSINAGKNDEIMMPSLNYIASANCTLYCHSTPHFVEVNKKTLGVDPFKLEEYLQRISFVKNRKCFNIKSKKHIKALICLHLFGHATNLDKLRLVCNKFNIILIEDAAEALGSFYKKRHLGTLGSIGVLSFNGNKIITTGSGGAVLTKSKRIAKFIKHIGSISKINHSFKFNYDRIGYNYKMSNLNAALGLAQLNKIEFYLKQKRKLFNLYNRVFKQNLEDYVSIFKEPENNKSNYWLQTLILKEKNIKLRDFLIKKLNSKNIASRPIWQPLHMISYLKKFPKMKMTVTEDLNKRIINIPSSSNLI